MPHRRGESGLMLSLSLRGRQRSRGPRANSEDQRGKERAMVQRIGMYFTKWISEVNWQLLLIIIPALSLFAFFSISAVTTTTTAAAAVANPFPSFGSLFLAGRPARTGKESNRATGGETAADRVRRRKEELDGSRMAVCLVGGARRFELTGPSIVERILKEYPNSDLFLHSPVDRDAYKFSLLKAAPRIAAVKLFQPKTLPETEAQVRVLTAQHSPNGIQGLLQYFHLVEGCLDLILAHQANHNFTYDWIVRTRVDGYWAGPLGPENFVPARYLIPPGSNYGGLNDRLGIGDFNTSVVALSRLSLIPRLDAAGLSNLNSEAAFEAQLATQGVLHITKRVPFCVVTLRKYTFPPTQYDVPVAAMSSQGPLSGAKCQPCKPACVGPCVANVMSGLDQGWSWTDWRNGSLKLCDARKGWKEGWEEMFDRIAGEKIARARRAASSLKLNSCISDFEEMRRRTAKWDAPPAAQICKLGFPYKSSKL